MTHMLCTPHARSRCRPLPQLPLQCNSIMGTVVVSFGADSAQPSGRFVVPPIDFGSIVLASANLNSASKKASNLGITNYLQVGSMNVFIDIYI